MTISLLCLHTAFAADLLSLDFDDPSAPWADASPNDVVLTPTTFTEWGFTGTGVTVDTTTPTPGGGDAAYFDGGSALAMGPEPGLILPFSQDFTLSFWFRSPGIVRPSPTQGARMHPIGFFGPGASKALNVALDEGSSNGVWVYWNGGGTPGIRSGANTEGLYTDDSWHQMFLTRDSGVVTLYVRHTDGAVDTIGSTNSNASIGHADPDAISYVGRVGIDLGPTILGYKGWLDDLSLVDVAIHPVAGPLDWCPDLPGVQWQDADSDFIGDLCDDCNDPDGDGECNPESIPFLPPLPLALLAMGLGLAGASASRDEA